VDATLNPDARGVVEEFGRLVKDVAGEHSYPPGGLDGAVDAAFKSMHSAFVDGDWRDAASIGGEPDETAVLVSLVEAAGTVRPSLAYPLVESWTAQRVLSRLEDGAGPDASQLVLADVTAPLRRPGDPAVGTYWPHAPRADQLLRLETQPDGDVVVQRLPREGANWTERSQADVTRPVYALTLPDDIVPEELGVLPAAQAETVAAEFVLLEAAEMLGCAEGLLRATLAHTTMREQFGRPLASFQALAHRLADSYTRVETLRSHVYYAAWVADYRPERLLEFALMAKGVAGDHCWHVANEAIQMHGAMGFTWEMGLQHQVGRIIARTVSHPAASDCLERVGASAVERGHMVQLVE
jgi:hypothetical protein